jgi:hypothetical protein
MTDSEAITQLDKIAEYISNQIDVMVPETYVNFLTALRMAKGKFPKSKVSATDNYVFPGQITIESFIRKLTENQ